MCYKTHPNYAKKILTLRANAMLTLWYWWLTISSDIKIIQKTDKKKMPLVHCHS